jgi:hypothetical protein
MFLSKPEKCYSVPDLRLFYTAEANEDVLFLHLTAGTEVRFIVQTKNAHVFRLPCSIFLLRPCLCIEPVNEDIVVIVALEHNVFQEFAA